MERRFANGKSQGDVSKNDAIPPPTPSGNVTNISQKEASQKLCPVVIARRNDEAIRLLSTISGLLRRSSSQ
jgi:hypothetical protein